MNDFKSYKPNDENADKSSGERGAFNGGGLGEREAGCDSNRTAGGKSGNQGDLRQTVNMATMLAQAFSGKSEGQIMQTIFEQAEQGKREGTLTNADLDNFFAAVAPFMDGFKRKKLAQIIERLKGI